MRDFKDYRFRVLINNYLYGEMFGGTYGSYLAHVHVHVIVVGVVIAPPGASHATTWALQYHSIVKQRTQISIRT